ncbi:hypothetical protein HH213_21125 [Duganella dendranthematis]|jgi:hypothetical protein|uniref:Uncharacterized protein n=1 Tax=Duganella dendranthematis TaxID=2728021 RepID=A0ABX6MDS0_9BURK|nr:hypothetical protein [Duganella dendranthematis]QJD92375.1 hypothetical protein HH213_21125 [Duganella dendranthematis]
MISPNNKWLIHTLLVGLIPILTRLLSWATTTTGTVDPLATVDFITLGLVMHVSILNETAHIPTLDNASKTLLNSISTVFIATYGALYAVATIGEHNAELINVSAVLTGSVGLCAVSTTLGFILFQHFSVRSSA